MEKIGQGEGGWGVLSVRAGYNLNGKKNLCKRTL